MNNSYVTHVLFAKRSTLFMVLALVLLVIGTVNVAKAHAVDVTNSAQSSRVLNETNSRLVANSDCTPKTFFGLVPWYNYVKVTPSNPPPGCDVEFNFLGANSSIPLVLLAVIDDLLRIAGLVTIFFILAGGVRYITSQGSPDETAKAQSTITNAVIGLAIALISVAVVSFIGNKLGN